MEAKASVREKIKDKLRDREVLFLMLLFIFGALLLFGYGAHLDQESEQGILYSNVLAYLEAINFEGNFYHELVGEGIISIRNSIEKDHGMAVFYPMVWIHEVNKHSPYIANLIWHVYIYSFFFLGVISFFYLIRDFFGRRVAFISTLLLFLTPRIFAEMHYNNKDIVVLALAIMTYYCGWRLYRKPDLWNAVLYGIVGAFSANMKIIGMLIWGLIGLYIGLSKLYKRTCRGKLLRNAFFGAMTFVIVFLCITPAAWGNIIGFFSYLFESAQDFRWNDYLLFQGGKYCKSVTAFPRSYLPVMIVLTTPVGIVVLMVLGLLINTYRLFSADKDTREKYRYLFMTVLGGAIPLGYAVIRATPVYNGWRHFYFVYASIMVLVAVAVDSILKAISKRNIGNIAFGGYICCLLLGILINHPYEYAYYNFLAGGNVEQRYELDYWDMSFKQALENIAEKDERTDIGITACDNPTKWGIDSQLLAIRGKLRCRLRSDVSFEEADYVIVNPTYLTLYSQPYLERILQEFSLFDTIKSYENVICYVYQRR